MLVALLVKFRIKDMKTTELGLLLQVLPVRIIAFVNTLGSHLLAKQLLCMCVVHLGRFSLPSCAQLQREMTKFRVLSRT